MSYINLQGILKLLNPRMDKKETVKKKILEASLFAEPNKLYSRGLYSKS